MWRGLTRSDLKPPSSIDYQHGRPSVEDVQMKGGSSSDYRHGHQQRPSGSYPGDLRDAITRLFTKESYPADLRDSIEGHHHDTRDSSGRSSYSQDFRGTNEHDLRSTISRQSREVEETSTRTNLNNVKEPVSEPFGRDLRDIISGPNMREVRESIVGQSGREYSGSRESVSNLRDLRNAITGSNQRSSGSSQPSYSGDLPEQSSRNTSYRDSGSTSQQNRESSGSAHSRDNGSSYYPRDSDHVGLHLRNHGGSQHERDNSKGFGCKDTDGMGHRGKDSDMDRFARDSSGRRQQQHHLQEDDYEFLAQALNDSVNSKPGWSKGSKTFIEMNSSGMPSGRLSQASSNIPEAASYILENNRLMMNMNQGSIPVSSSVVKPQNVASLATNPQLLPPSGLSVNLQPNLYHGSDIMMLNSLQNRNQSGVVSLAPVVVSTPLQIMDAVTLNKSSGVTFTGSFWDSIKKDGLLSYQKAPIKVSLDSHELDATSTVGEDFQMPTFPKKHTLGKSHSRSPPRKSHCSSRRSPQDPRSSPAWEKRECSSVSPRGRVSRQIREFSPRHMETTSSRRDCLSPRREQIRSRTPPEKTSGYARGRLQERSHRSREGSPRRQRQMSPRLVREISPRRLRKSSRQSREMSPQMVRERSRMVRELSPDRPQMVRELSPDRSRMVRELSPDRTRIVRELSSDRSRMVRELSPRMVRERPPRNAREMSPRMVRERSPRMVRELSPRKLRERSPRMVREMSPRKLRERSPLMVREISPQRARDIHRGGTRFSHERSPRIVREYSRESSPVEFRMISPNTLRKGDRIRNREGSPLRHSPGRSGFVRGNSRSPGIERRIPPLVHYREHSPEHVRRHSPRRTRDYSPVPVRILSPERYPKEPRRGHSPVPVRILSPERVRRYPLELHKRPSAQPYRSYSPEAHGRYPVHRVTRSPMHTSSPGLASDHAKHQGQSLSFKDIDSPFRDRRDAQVVSGSSPQVVGGFSPEEDRESPRRSWDTRNKPRRKRNRKRRPRFQVRQTFVALQTAKIESSSSRETRNSSVERSQDTPMEHQRNSPLDLAHEASPISMASNDDTEFGKRDKSPLCDDKEFDRDDESPLRDHKEFGREDISPVCDGEEFIIGDKSSKEFGKGNQSPLFDEVSLSPRSTRAVSPGTPTSDERHKAWQENDLQRGCSPVSLVDFPLEQNTRDKHPIDIHRDLSPVSLEEHSLDSRLEDNAGDGRSKSPSSDASHGSLIVTDSIDVQDSPRAGGEKEGEDLRVQLLRLREEKVELKLKKLEEESIETELRLQNLSPDILDYSPQRDTPSPLLDECEDERRPERYDRKFYGY